MDEQWQRCMEQFLESAYARSNSADTVRQYRWTLSRFFEFFPDTSPNEMTRADVEAFLSCPFGMVRNGSGTTSIATRNQRLAILRSFYSYAAGYDVECERGLEPLMSGRMPAHGLRPGKPPRVYKAMSGEEIRRFFSVIDEQTLIGKRDRALFLTYFYTARRRKEILDLKWGDITEGVVMDSHGRSRRGYTYAFRNKGASTQPETAELPEPAYNAIVAYLHACGRLEQMRAEDYVFVAFIGGKGHPPVPSCRRLGGNRALTVMKQYCKVAGLDYQRLGIHSLRHTSARERHVRGSDVMEVMRLLRQSSLDTTYRYLEQLTSAADPGAALLENAFRGL